MFLALETCPFKKAIALSLAVEIKEIIKMSLVTIGVPVKDRVWCLRKLLMAIESLKYPKDKIKLLFIDGYSTDGTFEVLKGWIAKNRSRYYDILLIQKQTNIPQARNICIKYMEGRYLLFWDSDIVPSRGMLKEMVDMFEADGSIGMIGADYLYDYGGLFARFGNPLTDKEAHSTYMGFTLIRREVFEKVGGFNESLNYGEDLDFGIKVALKTNYKILRAPKPVLHLKCKAWGREFSHSFVI